MIKRVGIALLALVGIGFSIFMIFWSHKTPPPTSFIVYPPKSPYTHYVAGEGTVESLNENIKIGTSFPDLVWEVFVQVGDHVKKGTPLFRLDTRQLEADLAAANEELRLACTSYTNLKTQFLYFKQLENKAAVSKQQYTQAYYAMKEARDRVGVATANVERIKTAITRSYIIAPIDGTVLQANARAGEFANVNPFDRVQLMIFGDTSLYQLRVNVAEEDAWRVMKGAPATAFVRGNPSLQIPLSFRYIEPYIIPKEVLTGADIERVDTRVLQVIYTFDPHNIPIYIGQLLDVYVEAKPSAV